MREPRRLLRSVVALVVFAVGLATAPAASGAAGVDSVGTRARSDYAVGTRTYTFVDDTRPTAADPTRGLPAKPDRTLDVVVFYPATGDPAAAVPATADARPTRGRFPLVVFSHGFTATGPVYGFLLQAWARAGYVIAAPTFPLSSGDGGMLTDYVNQPGDVSFVIDSMLDLPRSDPLDGHIDGHRIAAAGHSLGAITTMGVAYNECCRDKRIDAAVPISGIALPFFGEPYDWSGTPLLLIHGASDGTVPVVGSDVTFDATAPPVYYLRLPDAGHIDILLNDNGRLLTTVVVAFLDAELKHHRGGLRGLADEVAQSGLGELRVKPRHAAR